MCPLYFNEKADDPGHPLLVRHLTEYIYLYSNGLLLYSNVNSALLALCFVNFDIEGNGSALVESLVSIRVDAGEMYEYILS